MILTVDSTDILVYHYVTGERTGAPVTETVAKEYNKKKLNKKRSGNLSPPLHISPDYN